MRKFAIVPGITAALLAFGAPAASAEGPNWETFEVECQGEPITISLNPGQGGFTPGFRVDSTAVYIPVAFGAGTATAVLPDGTTMSESWPSEAKGGGNVANRSPRPMQTCTFANTVTLTEEEDGMPAGTVLTFSGSVIMMQTGKP